MRDVALALVIALLLLRTLRHPETGVFLWAWLSLMNPHKMAYSFAVNVPWAMLAVVATLLGLFFSKNRKPLPLTGGVILMLLLWLWMTITSAVSINPSADVWERWIFVSKIYFMSMVTLLLLRERKQIDLLVWMIVVSIGYFGFKGGLFTLATGGAYRVWGPPGSMVEENNALAVALIVVLPLMYYLAQTTTHRWVRNGLYFAMLSVGISILGSQSRGALLGLLAMSTALGLKSKHPWRFSLILLVMLSIGIAFMPDSWSERMSTIQGYEVENSAMSRIYTWQTLFNVALDRPLVGAGFRADNIELFTKYGPTDARFEIFRNSVWVAHSIYMQALGEHGFVGLALYLGIWIWTWFTASRVARQALQSPDLQDWVPTLMRMCQVSTIGFCAGGAFLSLMAFDLPYYLLIIVTLCQCAVRDRQGRSVFSAPGDRPAAGGSPGHWRQAR